MFADMPEVEKEVYSIIESQRIGLTLYTFYKEDRPLGSLLLDPVEDKILITEFHEYRERCETRAREEKKRARENKLEGKRNDRRTSRE
jgi:hypothetical protein